MNPAEQIKARRRELKEKLVELSGSVCVRCEQSFSYECMDFHHTNPHSKTFEINQDHLGRKSWEVILIEASKTIMLCANCHRSVHVNMEEDYFEDTFLRHRNERLNTEPEQGSLFVYWDYDPR